MNKQRSRAGIILTILSQTVVTALQGFRANLLRTLLSLAGITIGVYCIIGIFTLVDSIEINLKESVNKLGENVIYVQKWPWLLQDNYPWWKYINRPEANYRDYQMLIERLPEAEAVAYNMRIPGQSIKYSDYALDPITVIAVTPQYDDLYSLEFEEGRYFTTSDFQRGTASVILGNTVARALFPFESAVGKRVRLLGRQVRVVGVLQKEGENIFNLSMDQNVIIPVNYARNFFNVFKNEYQPTILVKGQESMSLDRLEDKLRGAMRTVRRLSPQEDDNFALNRITVFQDRLTSLFGKISEYGLYIAIFAMLVGGFGIANIMFVTVKERTSIIGTQKALGAKQYYILLQFIGEAIILCLIGGAVGILLVYLTTLSIGKAYTFEIILTMKNVYIGVGVSSLVGVVSGIVPAYMASRLDPIEAIRS